MDTMIYIRPWMSRSRSFKHVIAGTDYLVIAGELKPHETPWQKWHPLAQIIR